MSTQLHGPLKNFNAIFLLFVALSACDQKMTLSGSPHETLVLGAPIVTGTTPVVIPTPTWTWLSGGGGNGTFRYKLDDDTLSMGASETTATTFTSPVLTDGSHTLYVQERDALGNWSAIGSWTILVDAPPLAPSNVIGSLDSITNEPKWTWQSGGGGNGTYRYALDDASGPTTEIVGTTLVLTGDIATQDHTLFVQEKDNNGNWSEMSSGVSRAIASLPPTLGEYRTCVVLGNGKVKCWGYNSSGGLGIGFFDDRGDGPNEMGAKLPSVDLGTGRTVSQVWMGSYHACALLQNADVKCWGAGGNGQLGNGQNFSLGNSSNHMGDKLLAIRFGANRTVVGFSASYSNTCALFNTGMATCWGSAGFGVLGIGEPLNQNTPEFLPGINLGLGKRVQQIGSGDSVACAIMGTGELKCWGLNNYGQLGHNNTDTVGTDLLQMGDNLAPTFLGEGRTASAMAVGKSHVCALLDDHSIKCWGRNIYGVLGLENGDTYGDEGHEMESLLEVNLGSDFTPVGISSSNYHTCAISSAGKVKCWGDNSWGQIGIGVVSGNSSAIGNQVGEMGNSLRTIDFGEDASHTPYYATRISVGMWHSCALLNNGALKCWGSNYKGELGIGDNTLNKVAIGDEPGEMGNALQSVSLY